MEGTLPNLLIIGAMKCGTSSLHEYLALHPEIFMSDPKEIHYFNDLSYKAKSLDWYKSHFATDKAIRGTTPQNYTKSHNKYYQNIPQRINEHIPDVKMIYIVRDPVERYKSHVLESYYCDTPEDIAYSYESGNYIKTGMYFAQISAYLEHFKLEQIHILSLEDLMGNTLLELNKIFEFLNVKPMKDSSKFDFISNSSESKTYPRAISDNVLFRVGNKILPGVTEKIADNVSEKYFSDQTSKPKLTPNEEEKIREQFRADVNQFRTLTGTAFENWSI